jgi:hypothetical protein
MRDQLRWIQEVYRLNRVGVWLALAAAVLAALAGSPPWHSTTRFSPS